MPTPAQIAAALREQNWLYDAVLASLCQPAPKPQPTIEE